MARWNAGNVVAGLAIVGGVGAAVALMVRDRHAVEPPPLPTRQAYVVTLGPAPACPDVTMLHAARNSIAIGSWPDPVMFSSARCRYFKRGEVLWGVEDGGLMRFSHDGRAYWIHLESVTAGP